MVALASKRCIRCGNDSVVARGMCRTCYRRDRWPRGWPSYLDGCIRCSTPKGEATYRRYGLCKPCERVVVMAGDLGSWMQEYLALQAAARRGQTVERLMIVALDVVRELSCSSVAARLGLRIDTVWHWADGSASVPSEHHDELLEIWREVRGL